MVFNPVDDGNLSEALIIFLMLNIGVKEGSN